MYFSGRDKKEPARFGRDGGRGWELLVMALLLFVTACAATTLKAVWRNPEFAGRRLQKVLVVSVCREDTYRRIFEDSLTRQLRAHGVAAQPGYALFPEGGAVDKRKINSEIKAKGFDALIISMVTGQETRQTYRPGGFYQADGFYEPPMFFRTWYPYYARSYDFIHQPAYVEEYKVLTVETNVYDTSSDELIWSGVSETIVEGKVENLIISLVDVLTAGLVKAGLIAP